MNIIFTIYAKIKFLYILKPSLLSKVNVTHQRYYLLLVFKKYPIPWPHLCTSPYFGEAWGVLERGASPSGRAFRVNPSPITSPFLS
jgi:hypothetical protein